MRSSSRTPELSLLTLLLVAGFGCEGGGEAVVDSGGGGGAPAVAEPPRPSDAELEGRYVGAKQRIEAGESIVPGAGDAAFAELEAQLRSVAELASDVHLRANASLLLGSLFEERGDRRSAISFYRQAQKLVPGEASPHAVLALALSAEGEWSEAIVEQEQLVKMVPDDLEAWLLLGEMNVKAARSKDAALAYAAYEARRKGLLDALTLVRDGEPVAPSEERAECAKLLAPASDNGTALALMTALGLEPESAVRLEIVGTMGEQRLRGYEDFLRQRLAKEPDAAVKEAIEWALAEIARDPVDSSPGPVPELETAASRAAPGDAAPGAPATAPPADEPPVKGGAAVAGGSSPG